jgi:hypothetical protein
MRASGGARRPTPPGVALATCLSRAFMIILVAIISSWLTLTIA